MSANDKKWDVEIESETSWMGSRLGELWDWQ